MDGFRADDFDSDRDALARILDVFHHEEKTTADVILYCREALERWPYSAGLNRLCAAFLQVSWRVSPEITSMPEDVAAECAACWQAVLDADEFDYDALSALGGLLERAGDSSRAMELYDRAVTVADDGYVFWKRSCLLEEQGKLKEALESLGPDVCPFQDDENIISQKKDLLWALARAEEEHQQAASSFTPPAPPSA